MKQFLLVVGLLFLGTAALADVTLVRDGRAEAEIVMAVNAVPGVKAAAADLQEFIEKISGAKLPVVNTPSGKTAIYVGESEYTKKLGFDLEPVKKEGFRVKTGNNYVIVAGRDIHYQPFPYDRTDQKERARWQEFCGQKINVPQVNAGGPFLKELDIYMNDDTATWYAAAALLEQLGVRFYMPYENGTVIPQMKDIMIKDQDLVRIPKFPARQGYPYYVHRDPDAFKWFKRLGWGASEVLYNNHTTVDIINSPEIRKEHPEYYAVIGGVRSNDPSFKHPVPKLGDPGFRQSSINYLRKTFDAYPILQGNALGMPDGFGAIDEEDKKKWEPNKELGSKFSNYVWDYWVWAAGELKKTHPDKYLMSMVYTTYLEPPTNYRVLPDNVAITICYWTTWLTDPARAKYLLPIRDQWMKILPSKKMMVWDYFLHYRKAQPRIPAFFTKLLQEDMQVLQGKSAGKFIEILGDFYRKGGPRLEAPGLVHMTCYWQSKLFWEPDMNREKMLDEYYELYFGPARAEMKEFYEFAEHAFMNPVPRSKQTAESLKAHNDKYFEILTRARVKAGKDSVYDLRIVQIENEVMPLKKMHEGLKRTGPSFRFSKPHDTFVPDGDLTKKFWTHPNNWITMVDLVTGEPIANNSTRAALRMDPAKKQLFIAVECNEIRMNKIRAGAVGRDDIEIFNDDVVEIYLETPERSYFKIVVNSNGAILDECTDRDIIERDSMPVMWNPDIKANVKKFPDKWTVEIVIPTNDFGSLGPTADYPWGINIGRTRFAGGQMHLSAIAPTGKGLYAVVNKWANFRN